MLLTRSPLIRPASWPSPFDLHVLSTPPAFVLSQNQTLRQCQHATPPPKRQGNRHNKEQHRSGISRTPPPTEAGSKVPINTKAHHDTTSQQTTWHRLLGTLLSSQRTDAHPVRPLRAGPGGYLIRCDPLRSRHRRLSHPVLLSDHRTQGALSARNDLSEFATRRDRPPDVLRCSFLPAGGLEDITRPASQRQMRWSEACG